MMQKVDPFIPLNDRRPSRPPQRPAGDTARRMTERYRPPARSFVPSSSRPVPAPRPITAKPPVPPRPQPELKSDSRIKRRLRSIASLMLQIVLFTILLGVGFLARSSLFGQAMILVYAVVALIIKIESRTTFLLALISLGVVLIGSLRSDGTLAATFAVYAFLFLIIGTISLGREVRSEI